MSRLILALDQSTSATKSIVFTAEGQPLDRFSLDHKQHYPAPAYVEHDAEELFQNSISVLASAATKFTGQLGALAITNQRETFVVFERGTGRPLHNAVVWQCRRGDTICNELRTAGKEGVVSARTGLKIDSYFSGPKITALLRRRPEIAAKVASGDALIGTIDTYLLYRLTNGAVFATDHTNACRTLLYNLETRSWDAELCELFGVPMKALPEIRDSTALFGKVDLPGHAAHGMTIAGVMGDSQAALLAHRCLTPGQTKVTLGTGSSILLNTGKHLAKTGIRTVVWAHKGEPTYGLEGIISFSAATIAWLKDQMGLIQSAGETEAAALAVTDNGGVYLVPAFAGLSAPHWSPEARAAIVGLSAASTRNHIIRGALEAIAYQIKDALDSMRDAAGGLTVSVIHADGGATKNRFLMQFLADMLQIPVAVSNSPDFSPMGAALAGAVGLGIHRDVEALAGLPSAEQRFLPTMPVAE
ncbi:MAG: FGGY family carbohydrate kinase, partial [Phycisphaerae bacterium]